MRGVTGFEKDLVRQGTILVKLYFSVTEGGAGPPVRPPPDDPLRQWKLSEIDMQAQDRWDDFTDRKYEMLKRTSTIGRPVDDRPLRRQAARPAERHEGHPQRRRLRRTRPRPRLRARSARSSSPARRRSR